MMLTANNALNFDGVNDYVQGAPLNLGTGNFTIETSFNATSTANYPILFAQDVSGVGTPSFRVEINSATNKPDFFISDSSSSTSLLSTIAISPGTWNDYAIVRDGNTYSAFVNGVAAGSVVASGNINQSSDAFNFRLGARGTGTNAAQNPFDGSIDEVRIWNVTRSQAQIQGTMNAELVGDEPNLLDYYNFDSGTAGGSNAGFTTLTDAAVGAKSDTLFNFALTGATSNWVSGNPSMQTVTNQTDPYVVSINLANPTTSTTSANSVSFTATFSGPVTGVDPTDFSLVETGNVSGTVAQVTPVSTSVYTVIVNGITGNGTLGLNLVDTGTIHDLAGNPLTNPSAASSFSNAGTYGSGYLPQSVVVGDFNGDGKPDLAVANFYSNSVSVFLGNGNGTFQSKQTFGTGATPQYVTAGDLNGDGHLDLVVANRSSASVSVLLGNGNGTFQAQQVFATESLPTSVAVGDLNGDGKTDIVVTTVTNNTVDVLMGNGNGTFLPFQSFATGNAPTQCCWQT